MKILLVYDDDSQIVVCQSPLDAARNLESSDISICRVFDDMGHLYEARAERKHFWTAPTTAISEIPVGKDSNALIAAIERSLSEATSGDEDRGDFKDLCLIHERLVEGERAS